MEAFCLLTDRAFALFDVVGGFFVALAWIRSKQLGGVKWLNVYLHDNTQLCVDITFLVVLGVFSSSELDLAPPFFFVAVASERE